MDEILAANLTSALSHTKDSWNPLMIECHVGKTQAAGCIHRARLTNEQHYCMETCVGRAEEFSTLGAEQG